MSVSTSDIIDIGRYRFKVIKNIIKHNDILISHTYKVGGDYADCINVSYKYSNNVPISVSMPHLLYEPECAIGSILEKGTGTELLIKSAIRYAYTDVPSLSIFTFDDMSHIDCNKKDITKRVPRKPSNLLSLHWSTSSSHIMTRYEARYSA